MKLSIVITYWNRLPQLFNTLFSIWHFKGDYPIELIIVDDDSDKEHYITPAIEFFGFDYRIIRLKDREIHDPVIPLNTGFNAVTGDVVLINNAECMHMGDIISYIFNNIKEKSYFNFGTYSVNYHHNAKLNRLDWINDDVMKKAHEIIEPKHSLPAEWKDGDVGWYVDLSAEHYSLLPFCAALNRSDLEKLNGLDERFVHGIGYADTDFVIRVNNLGLDTKIIMDPFCVHQAHSPTIYEPVKFALNNKLIASLQDKHPGRIKAPENKIYVR